jgi:hypothetical protein
MIANMNVNENITSVLSQACSALMNVENERK